MSCATSATISWRTASTPTAWLRNSRSTREEQAHADSIAQRIVQLGGKPNFSPEGLSSRSHSEYVEGDTLLDMIKEDLIAERIAIDSYKEIIEYLGDKDTTTRRMFEIGRAHV